jgi:hypothetical protein
VSNSVFFKSRKQYKIYVFYPKNSLWIPSLFIRIKKYIQISGHLIEYWLLIHQKLVMFVKFQPTFSLEILILLPLNPKNWRCKRFSWWLRIHYLFAFLFILTPPKHGYLQLHSLFIEKSVCLKSCLLLFRLNLSLFFKFLGQRHLCRTYLRHYRSLWEGSEVYIVRETSWHS